MRPNTRLAISGVAIFFASCGEPAPVPGPTPVVREGDYHLYVPIRGLELPSELDDAVRQRERMVDDTSFGQNLTVRWVPKDERGIMMLDATTEYYLNPEGRPVYVASSYFLIQDDIPGLADSLRQEAEGICVRAVAHDPNETRQKVLAWIRESWDQPGSHELTVSTVCFRHHLDGTVNKVELWSAEQALSNGD